MPWGEIQMMKIEEIIASLLDQARDKDSLAGGDPDSVFTHDAEALRAAAALLRASGKLDRSRWEGCRYCKDIPTSILKGFCYACGRPLTEEAWAELERRIGGIESQ